MKTSYEVEDGHIRRGGGGHLHKRIRRERLAEREFKEVQREIEDYLNPSLHTDRLIEICPKCGRQLKFEDDKCRGCGAPR